MRYKKFLTHERNQQGHAHLVVPLAVIVLVALIGGKVYQDLSHAATATMTKNWSTASAWSAGKRSNTAIVGNAVNLSIAGHDAMTYPGTSKRGTIVLNGATNFIINRYMNKFTVSQGMVYRNGQKAGYTAEVARIVFLNNDIYQENSAGRWFAWTGRSWSRCSDPVIYITSGSITLTMNAGSTAKWNSLSVKTKGPNGTAVTTAVRTSTNGAAWSAWKKITQTPSTKYLQIQIQLRTASSKMTPTISSLTLTYSVSAAEPVAGGSSGGSSGSSGSGTSGQGTTTSYGCTVSGVVAPCMNDSNTGSGSNGYGTPAFDDEFNKGSLNTSAWTPYWFGNGDQSNNTTMDASNVKVDSNGLELTLASNSTGGLVSTNPNDGVAGHTGFQIEPSAGKSVFVEYEAEFPGTGNQAYNWPALWITGQSWPTTGEIDLMEGFGDLESHTIYSGCSNFCNPETELGNWSPGYHTFGVLWTTTSTTFYFDGKNMGGSPLPYNVGPLYLVMENSLVHHGPASVPATMTVHYARVWQG